MRSGLADRLRFICPVDSVALDAQSHPPRLHRITWSRSNDFAVVRVGRILDAARDRERPGGARCGGFSNRDGVDLFHLAVFYQCQLAVFETDDAHCYRPLAQSVRFHLVPPSDLSLPTPREVAGAVPMRRRLKTKALGGEAASSRVSGET